jgi:hypothetical protein
MRSAALKVVVSVLLFGCDDQGVDDRSLDREEAGSGSVHSALASPVARHPADELICGLLADDLWVSRDAYDATHYLLIPLEYAYLTGDLELQRCFTAYMARLSEAVAADLVELDALAWLQHLHLVARYVRHSGDLRPYKWICREFVHQWREADAWHWGRRPFTGMAERIEWKLATDSSQLASSFHDALIDEDFFVLALGTDLHGLQSLHHDLPRCPGCDEAARLFLAVFEHRVVWQGDRWLIDVGRWTDHPTHAFAGYHRRPVGLDGADLPPARRAGQVTDSSHGSRFPSWIRSLALALGEHDRENLLRLRDGLRNQFLRVILAPDQGRVPMLHNYMDGHNGWYRWQYATHQGAHSGYGPYALSGAFACGWWALLGGPEVAGQYRRLLEAFPLGHAELLLYADSSTREVHPTIRSGWTNGLMSRLAEMSVVVAERVVDPSPP